MATSGFKPVLYLKAKCPFCMKVEIFLLESGLWDRFEVRQFEPETREEEQIRAELAPHFEKVTFPAVQYAPGKYMNESDAIIERYARENGIDTSRMLVLDNYANGVLPRLTALFRENAELKKATA